MMLDKAGIPYDTNTCVDAMRSIGLKSAPALDVGGKLMEYGAALAWVREQQEATDEEQ